MNPSSEPTIFSTLPSNVMACLVDKLSLQSVARLGVTCKEVNIGTIKALKRLKLVKDIYHSELESAFAVKSPITLKLRYFSYEVRRKSNLSIKNTNAERLEKIRSAGNIKLLLKKEIIEEEDLEFLFDEDLATLGVWSEESQWLFPKSFDEIPSEEDASYMCRYIIKKKLSVSDAIDLTPLERAYLDNEKMYYSVVRYGLNINKAKNLSVREFSRLFNNGIQHLIETWTLSIETALTMSDDEWSILSKRLIYNLVARGELPFDGIRKLTTDQLANAIKIGEEKDWDVTPFMTFWVLRRLGMSVEAILALDYDQIVRLSSHAIHKLLQCKKLSLEKALSLTEVQTSILDSRLFCKLFLSDKWSLEEAEKLSDEERERLKFADLCKLIVRGKVKLEDAVNPNRQEAIYKLRRLYEFICEDKVSVEFVEGLSDEEFKIFENQWIIALIWRGALEMKDVIRLPAGQIKKFGSQWISNLIINGFLSMEEASNLSEDEFNNLDNSEIYYLIADRKLDVEEAKGLSVDLYDILSSISISSDIRMGHMSLDDAKALALENADDDSAQEDVTDEGRSEESSSGNEEYENSHS